MTGQVKEDILSRLKELGLKVEDGTIAFSDHMLNWEEEAVIKEEQFEFIQLDGSSQEITVPVGGLLFSFCQIPIVYTKKGAKGTEIKVSFKDGKSELIKGNVVSSEICEAVFKRKGTVSSIHVVFGD
jgi:hypothetical protein